MVEEDFIQDSSIKTTDFVSKSSINSIDSSIIQPLYKDHFLVAEKNLPPLPFELKNSISKTEFFPLYVIILVFWAFFYQRHHKGLIGIINSFFNNNVLFQELNDKSGSNGIVSLGMFLLGITTLAVFSFQFLNLQGYSNFYFDSQNSEFGLLFIGFAIILGLSAKTILILFSGWAFNSVKVTQGYLTLLVVSVQILGIALLPMAIFLSYGEYLPMEWMANLGAIFIGLTFLYRILRSFFLGLKQTNSQVFHIILYICTLEILPLLVISRFVLQMT